MRGFHQFEEVPQTGFSDIAQVSGQCFSATTKALADATIAITSESVSPFVSQLVFFALAIFSDIPMLSPFKTGYIFRKGKGYGEVPRIMLCMFYLPGFFPVRPSRSIQKIPSVDILPCLKTRDSIVRDVSHMREPSLRSIHTLPYGKALHPADIGRSVYGQRGFRIRRRCLPRSHGGFCGQSSLSVGLMPAPGGCSL